MYYRNYRRVFRVNEYGWEPLNTVDHDPKINDTDTASLLRLLALDIASNPLLLLFDQYIAVHRQITHSLQRATRPIYVQ